MQRNEHIEQALPSYLATTEVTSPELDELSEADYRAAANGWAEDKAAHFRPEVPEWFSLTAVAYLLGVAKSTVHMWLQRGYLPFFKGPGGRQAVVRIHRDDLQNFVLRNKRKNVSLGSSIGYVRTHKE